MILQNIDEFDAYIIVSFVNATLVLSIGETVEEVTDTGFLATTPTLDVHQLGDDALLQVFYHYAKCVEIIFIIVINTYCKFEDISTRHSTYSC